MKALLVSRIGPDFSGCHLADVPMPHRAPGQILVRVRAASLNFPDLLMTQGLYQLKPEPPFVPGMDVAGEVVEADPDSGFRAGDAVVCGMRLGGLAQYAAVDRSAVRRKPENMDFAAAAAFGATYLTAYVALVRCGNLQPGEWVLVHGATGGVGLAVVDLAKALGARVIATSASSEKLGIVSATYSPDATLIAAGRFRETVLEISGGGVDIVCDPVGGDVFDESTRCIRFGGKLLVVGFASGRIPSLSANIPLLKGFSIVGVRAGEYGRRFPDRGRENLDQVWAMAGDGLVRPRVHAEFPLSRWLDALKAMAARQHVGKLVIRPDLD